jgi:hypothetical protein
MRHERLDALPDVANAEAPPDGLPAGGARIVGRIDSFFDDQREAFG